MVKSNIRPMLDISTSNLTQEDTGILTQMAQGYIAELGLGRVVSHEYGYILFINGDSAALAETVDAMDKVGLSANVAYIYRGAVECNAMLVNFDADADTVEGLPTYDW